MTALRRLRRAAAFAAVAAAALLSASCGGGGTGTVTGKITVNGQPLPNGLITFLSEVGNQDPFPAYIKDGLYETGQIPAGPCKVTISHSDFTRPSAPENDLVPPPAARAGGAGTVPDKYASADTSGLTFTVKAGPNTYDQDLKN